MTRPDLGPSSLADPAPDAVHVEVGALPYGGVLLSMSTRLDDDPEAVHVIGATQTRREALALAWDLIRHAVRR